MRPWVRLGALAPLVVALLLSAAIRPAGAEGTADLAVTTELAPRVVRNGGHVLYTVTVTNRGPDAATDVAVEVLFPEDWTCPCALACSQGVLYGTTCLVGSLPAGQSATAQAGIEVFVPSKGMGRAVDVGGQATAATADPDSGNNRAADTIRVIGPLPPDPE